MNLTQPQPAQSVPRHPLVTVQGITLTAFDGLSSYRDHAATWAEVPAMLQRGITEYLHRYAICTSQPYSGYRRLRFTVAWRDGTIHHGSLEMDRHGTEAGAERSANIVQTHVKNFALANYEQADAIGEHCRHLLHHCEL